MKTSGSRVLLVGKIVLCILLTLSIFSAFVYTVWPPAMTREGSKIIETIDAGDWEVHDNHTITHKKAEISISVYREWGIELVKFPNLNSIDKREILRHANALIEKYQKQKMEEVYKKL